MSPEAKKRLVEKNTTCIQRKAAERAICMAHQNGQPAPADAMAVVRAHKPPVKAKKTKTFGDHPLKSLKAEAKARHIPYWYAMNAGELTTALHVKADGETFKQIVAAASKRWTAQQAEYRKRAGK